MAAGIQRNIQVVQCAQAREPGIHERPGVIAMRLVDERLHQADFRSSDALFVPPGRMNDRRSNATGELVHEP
jgi:hypothetical protein